MDEVIRGIATGGIGGATSGALTLFEELGFHYVGPVDAHDLENLVAILENIRDNNARNGGADKPVLLHIKSVKGKGESVVCTMCAVCMNGRTRHEMNKMS